MKSNFDIKEKIYRNLGAQLRAVRLSAGLTPEEALAVARFSKQRLALLEAGNYRVCSNMHLSELVCLLLRYEKILNISWIEPRPGEIESGSNSSSSQLPRFISEERLQSVI